MRQARNRNKVKQEGIGPMRRLLLVATSLVPVSMFLGPGECSPITPLRRNTSSSKR